MSQYPCKYCGKPVDETELTQLEEHRLPMEGHTHEVLLAEIGRKRMQLVYERRQKHE